MIEHIFMSVVASISFIIWFIPLLLYYPICKLRILLPIREILPIICILHHIAYGITLVHIFLLSQYDNVKAWQCYGLSFLQFISGITLFFSFTYRFTTLWQRCNNLNRTVTTRTCVIFGLSLVPFTWIFVYQIATQRMGECILLEGGTAVFGAVSILGTIFLTPVTEVPQVRLATARIVELIALFIVVCLMSIIQSLPDKPLVWIFSLLLVSISGDVSFLVFVSQPLWFTLGVYYLEWRVSQEHVVKLIFLSSEKIINRLVHNFSYLNTTSDVIVPLVSEVNDTPLSNESTCKNSSIRIGLPSLGDGNIFLEKSIHDTDIKNNSNSSILKSVTTDIRTGNGFWMHVMNRVVGGGTGSVKSPLTTDLPPPLPPSSSSSGVDNNVAVISNNNSIDIFTSSLSASADNNISNTTTTTTTTTYKNTNNIEKKTENSLRKVFQPIKLMESGEYSIINRSFKAKSKSEVSLEPSMIVAAEAKSKYAMTHQQRFTKELPFLTKENAHEFSTLLQIIQDSDLYQLQHFMTSRSLGLLEHVDSKGCSALHHAVRAGDTRIIRFLLDMGGDANMFNLEGMTPLHEAASPNFNNESDRSAIMMELLRKGAIVNLPTPNGLTALHLVILSGQLGALNTLLRLDANPLHNHTTEGDGLSWYDVHILQAGVAVSESFKKSPLMLAVEMGADMYVSSMVNSLQIRKTVEGMKPRPLSGTRCTHGMALLHIALALGNTRVVEVLLNEAQCSPWVINEETQMNVFHFAAISDRTDSLAVLLRHLQLPDILPPDNIFVESNTENSSFASSVKSKNISRASNSPAREFDKEAALKAGASVQYGAVTLSTRAMGFGEAVAKLRHHVLHLSISADALSELEAAVDSSVNNLRKSGKHSEASLLQTSLLVVGKRLRDEQCGRIHSHKHENNSLSHRRISTRTATCNSTTSENIMTQLSNAVNAADAWGMTPLHYAILNRNANMIFILCGYGAEFFFEPNLHNDDIVKYKNDDSSNCEKSVKPSDLLPSLMNEKKNNDDTISTCQSSNTVSSRQDNNSTFINTTNNVISSQLYGERQESLELKGPNSPESKLSQVDQSPYSTNSEPIELPQDQLSKMLEASNIDEIFTDDVGAFLQSLEAVVPGETVVEDETHESFLHQVLRGDKDAVDWLLQAVSEGTKHHQEYIKFEETQQKRRHRNQGATQNN